MNTKLVILGITALTGISYLLINLIDQSANILLNAEVSAQFLAYKSKFGKNYASLSELAYRQQIFAETLKRISAHNDDLTQTYQLGITKFSDMTDEERKSKYLATFPKSNIRAKCEKYGIELPIKNDDQVVDWVAAKKVQAVKEQGDCSSDYAFAAVGALESAYAIYKNIEVPSISEQEIIDCSDNYGNIGCVGGMMGFSYDYIHDHKINTEEDYPYIANGQKCNSKLIDNGPYTLKGCVRLKENVQELINAVRHQPVAVVFDAKVDFFDYTSGIYNPKACSGQPSHAVLVVGFNLEASTPYFQAKNSWGTNWGDKGFFKIAIGKGKGTCNICGSTWNYYPTLETNTIELIGS